MTRWQRLSLGSLLWLVAGSAWAGECDLPAIDWQAPTAADRDRLASLAERCPQDAEVFAALGALELTLGDPAAAQVALERALLLNPKHFGARIDLGLSLYALGQRQAARALLRPVLERPDLPEGAAARIVPVLSAPAQTGRGRHEFALSAGYSSNRNLGAQVDQLTLTLPQGRLTLPIGAASRPDPGVIIPYRYRYDHTRGLGLEFRGVHSPDGPGRRQTLELQWRGEDWAAVLSHDVWQGEELGQFASLTWAPGRARTECVISPLAQVGYQRYAAAPDLSGAIVRLGANRRCGPLGIFAAMVYDIPDSGRRPGGARMGLQAVVRWQQVIDTWALDASVAVTHLRDRDGYSELLAGGARRNLTRLTPRLELRHPLGDGLYATFELEHEEQVSNLPLFDLRLTQASAGLLWIW